MQQEPSTTAKFIRITLFLLAPAIIGVGCASVLIYGSKGIYSYVHSHMKPLTVIIPETTQPLPSTPLGSPSLHPSVKPAGVAPHVMTAQIASADSLQNVFVDNLKTMLPRKSNIPVSSDAYLAGDLEANKILIEKNGKVSYPIASITKLVTAAVAKDLIKDDALITITAAAYNTEGDSGKLKKAEKIKAADLYYPLLMVSSNDAAEAFAQYYGREKFIQAMNDKVASWGAFQTHFYDPSGLDSRNVSTPQDLFKIIQSIYKYKRDIIAITHTKTKVNGKRTWVNPTHFLNLSSYLGGKNGYTVEADKTAISIFSVVGKDGATHPVGIIALLSNNRDNDVLNIMKNLEKDF